MELYAVFYGSRYTGAGLESIYLNEKNAIKRAMRLVYRQLKINATKGKGWVWFDDYDLIAVEKILPADLKDYNGDSSLPRYLRYKDYLESIPHETLEQMRKQAENRKLLMEKVAKLKKRSP